MNHECPLCGKGYFFEFDLLFHVISSHAYLSRDRNYYCWCGEFLAHSRAVRNREFGWLQTARSHFQSQGPILPHYLEWKMREGVD